MSAPTTSVLYNSTTPAPDAGQQNAKPRSDGGDPLQQITFETPNTGGVLAKTANYTAAAGDCGKLVSFNSGSAVVYTLPATPPVVGAAQWQVQVQNRGAGALSITPTSAALLDGSASTLVLAQGSGVTLFTDGTNYFSERGVSPSIAGLATQAGVQQGTYVSATDTGSANAYAITLSPAPTVGVNFGVCFKAAHANTGASTLAVNGVTYSLKKGGVNPLQLGDISLNQMVYALCDGTNFQAVGLAPALVLVPVIRGSSVATGAGSSLNVPFPAGSQVGDLAILGGFGAYNTSNPSGWTQITLSNGYTWNGIVAWKILTSGDLSTGYVTVSFGGAYDCVGYITTFIGPTGGIRESQATTSPATTPQTLTTTSAVLSSDVALYLYSTRKLATVAITPGSGSANSLQGPTVTTNTNSLLADQAMPGGALSVVYGGTGPSCAMVACQVIVEGVSSGVGSVSSVGLTMPSDFTVTGSPVTGYGTMAVTANVQSANLVKAGPASGGPAAPTYRALVPADVPVFVASGASHAAGIVPDPGSSAGTARFLREDATFAVPATATTTHSESLTDGAGNFIFAGGDVVTVVGVPN